MSKASHDVLVISDSDTRLRLDYLSNIVAPLADPKVACACTLFKVTQAERLVEQLEALTINADFMPSVVFAEVTGASTSLLFGTKAAGCASQVGYQKERISRLA